MALRKKTRRALTPTAKKLADILAQVQSAELRLKRIIPLVDMIERDAKRYARGLDKATYRLSLKEPL